MTTKNLSASQAASAYLSAKSAKVRNEIAAYIASKAAVSSRVRWERLHKAVTNKDTARVKYYAATGDDRVAALATLKAASAPAPVQQAPKAPKAPARKPAKAVTKASKPVRASASTPLEDEAARIMAAALKAGISPEQAAAVMAAFVTL